MKKLLSIFLLSFFILTISLALYALDPVCFHQCQDPPDKKVGCFLWMLQILQIKHARIDKFNERY